MIPTDSLARNSIPIEIKTSEPEQPEKRGNSTNRSSNRPLSRESRRSTRNRKNSLTVSERGSLTEEKLHRQLQYGSAVRRKTKQKIKMVEETKRDDLQSKIDAINDEERKRIEKLKFQTRGKDYTYGPNGDVIMIEKINLVKLPLKTFNPNVNILDEREQLAAHQLMNAEKNERAQTVNKRRQAPVISALERKKKRLPALEKSNSGHKTYISDRPTHPMVDLKALKPAAGVVYKEGNRTMKGERIHRDVDSLRKTSKIPLTIQSAPPGAVLPDTQDSHLDVLSSASQRSLLKIVSTTDTSDAGRPIMGNSILSDASDLPAQSNEALLEPPQPIQPQPPANRPDPSNRTRKLGALKNVQRNRRPGRAGFLGNFNYRQNAGNDQDSDRPRDLNPIRKRPNPLPPPIYPATLGHGFMTSHLRQENKYASYIGSDNILDDLDIASTSSAKLSSIHSPRNTLHQNTVRGSIRPENMELYRELLKTTKTSREVRH